MTNLISTKPWDNGHIDPERDGINHINIYSKGRTALGRALSNFAWTPFESPLFGKFQSMEGYYYWVKSGMVHHELRTLYGFKAKQVGRLLPIVKRDNFQEYLIHGLMCKLKDNPGILEGLINNTLPLKHYYLYYDKVIEVNSSDWMLYGYDYLKRVFSIFTSVEELTNRAIPDCNDLGLCGL